MLSAQRQATKSRLQSSPQVLLPSHCPVLSCGLSQSLLFGTAGDSVPPAPHHAFEGHGISEDLQDGCEWCPSNSGIIGQ